AHAMARDHAADERATTQIQHPADGRIVLRPEIEPIRRLAHVRQPMQRLQRPLRDHLGGDRWQSELLRESAEEDALAHDVANPLVFEKLRSDRRLKAHLRIRLRVSAITSSIARSSSSWITRYAMGSARSIAGLTKGRGATRPRAYPFRVDRSAVPYSIQCQKNGSQSGRTARPSLRAAAISACVGRETRNRRVTRTGRPGRGRWRWTYRPRERARLPSDEMSSVRICRRISRRKTLAPRASARLIARTSTLRPRSSISRAKRLNASIIHTSIRSAVISTPSRLPSTAMPVMRYGRPSSTTRHDGSTW